MMEICTSALDTECFYELLLKLKLVAEFTRPHFAQLMQDLAKSKNYQF